MNNNKIEQFVLSLKEGDRFAKREKVAVWIQDFVKKDKDCESFYIERINLPNDEYFRYCVFSAYGNLYFWIDYLRYDLLDSSRLECVDADNNEIILFTDDFGVQPVALQLPMWAAMYGKERIYPK